MSAVTSDLAAAIAVNNMRVRQGQPAHMVEIPRADWPRSGDDIGGAVALRVWRSRDFLAVLYDDRGHERLSVNRTTQNPRTGEWRDGITWDELMWAKEQCGYGDRWSIEVYPPESEVVNQANMRHLWLLDAAPPCAWTGAE